MQKRDGVRIQSGQSQVTSDLSSYSDKQREMDEQQAKSSTSSTASSVSRLFAHVDGGSGGGSSPNNNKSVRRSKEDGPDTSRSINSSPVKQRQRIEDEIIKIREVIIESVISSSQKGGNLRSTQESQLSSKSGPTDTVVKIIPSPRLPSADILRPSVSIRPSIAAVVRCYSSCICVLCI